MRWPDANPNHTINHTRARTRARRNLFNVQECRLRHTCELLSLSKIAEMALLINFNITLPSLNPPPINTSTVISSKVARYCSLAPCQCRGKLKLPTVVTPKLSNVTMHGTCLSAYASNTQWMKGVSRSCDILMSNTFACFNPLALPQSSSSE